MSISLAEALVKAATLRRNLLSLNSFVHIFMLNLNLALNWPDGGTAVCVEVPSGSTKLLRDSKQHTTVQPISGGSLNLVHNGWPEAFLVWIRTLLELGPQISLVPIDCVTAPKIASVPPWFESQGQAFWGLELDTEDPL